jgi:hypothetical protein
MIACGDSVFVVIISNTGTVIGKTRKNHIPRVGDFNEVITIIILSHNHWIYKVRLSSSETIRALF